MSIPGRHQTFPGVSLDTIMEYQNILLYSSIILFILGCITLSKNSSAMHAFIFMQRFEYIILYLVKLMYHQNMQLPCTVWSMGVSDCPSSQGQQGQKLLPADGWSDQTLQWHRSTVQFSSCWHGKVQTLLSSAGTSMDHQSAATILYTLP